MIYAEEIQQALRMVLNLTRTRYIQDALRQAQGIRRVLNALVACHASTLLSTGEQVSTSERVEWRRGGDSSPWAFISVATIDTSAAYAVQRNN